MNQSYLEQSSEGAVRILRMVDTSNQNALSVAMVESLMEAFHACAESEETRVIVLAGLPDMFCSGADRSMLDSLTQGEIAPGDILLPKVLLDVPVPVIAAMEGHAVGGGLALAACADIVLAANDSRYGLNFTDLGFTPGMGTTKLLEHLMSPALAHELLYSGELRKGSAFSGLGAFNAILPRAKVFTHALALAARIAEKPRLTLELLKRTLSLPRRQAFEATLTMESLMHRITFAQPGLIERLKERHHA